MDNTINSETMTKQIARSFDYSLLVDTAVLLGEIMLKNGAETNRVEKAMDKLLRTSKMKHIEAVVMTTSIIVTLSDPTIEHITAVSRIHDRITNLNRVNLAYELVKEYCRDEISLEDLFRELKKIKTTTLYSIRLKMISLILIPPCFTILLNGTVIDAFAALICAILLAALDTLFTYVKTNDFLKNTVLMIGASIMAVGLNALIHSNIQAVVVGFVMPYVPGVAITNAARDTFNADYMSGSARLLDALVQALEVALGVYVGLYIGNLSF